MAALPRSQRRSIAQGWFDSHLEAVVGLVTSGMVSTVDTEIDALASGVGPVSDLDSKVHDQLSSLETKASEVSDYLLAAKLGGVARIHAGASSAALPGPVRLELRRYANAPAGAIGAILLDEYNWDVDLT